MSIPWWLKPDFVLHRDLIEAQEQANRSMSSSHATDQQQDREIARLQKRVSELELQLLALETCLSEQGLLPSRSEEPEPEASPAVFPSRTEESISCPACGRRQKGNRERCYSCGLPFQYENE